MSVLKNKRKESNLEFLHTARELQIYSLRRCTGFPKRFTFTINNVIADLATQVHMKVKHANSIYPTNQHEAQLRRDNLIDAKALLQDLVAEIEVAAEMFGVDGNILNDWMALIWKENELIKGLMKSDKERYKTLP